MTFDGLASIAASVTLAIDAAAPAKLRELLELLVEKVVATDDGANAIDFVAAARPFFAEQPLCLWRPRTDSNPQYQRSVLDWYLGVG